MSFLLKQKKQLIDWCEPWDERDPEGSLQRRADIAADIKPVKFGDTTNWTDGTGEQLLCFRDVPREKHLIIARVEGYTVNWTSGAADFGMWEPPPPGFAYWKQDVIGGSTSFVAAFNVTSPLAPTHLVLDAEEFLIFPPASRAYLFVNLTAGPTGEERELRALVYAFEVGPEVVKRIAGAQALISPT